MRAEIKTLKSAIWHEHRSAPSIHNHYRVPENTDNRSVAIIVILLFGLATADANLAFAKFQEFFEEEKRTVGNLAENKISLSGLP